MLTEAASSAGRAAPTLVAVTKAVDEEVAGWVLDAGCQDLGENRADAFARRAERFAAMGREPRWHFIGHLQRNKVRRVLEHVHVLHSIDSERLAGTVARVAEELGRSIDVFIQVNLTGEDEKYGFSKDEAGDAALRLASSPAINVRGLMAMGPMRAHRTVREVFEEARELASSLEEELPEVFLERRCELSMGMSGDAALATELGSDLVRVGSALFVDLPMPATPERAPQAPMTTDALNRAEDD